MPAEPSNTPLKQAQVRRHSQSRPRTQSQFGTQSQSQSRSRNRSYANYVPLSEPPPPVPPIPPQYTDTLSSRVRTPSPEVPVPTRLEPAAPSPPTAHHQHYDETTHAPNVPAVPHVAIPSSSRNPAHAFPEEPQEPDWEQSQRSPSPEFAVDQAPRAESFEPYHSGDVEQPTGQHAQRQRTQSVYTYQHPPALFPAQSQRRHLSPYLVEPSNTRNHFAPFRREANRRARSLSQLASRSPTPASVAGYESGAPAAPSGSGSPSSTPNAASSGADAPAAPSTTVGTGLGVGAPAWGDTPGQASGGDPYPAEYAPLDVPSSTHRVARALPPLPTGPNGPQILGTGPMARPPSAPSRPLPPLPAIHRGGSPAVDRSESTLPLIPPRSASLGAASTPVQIDDWSPPPDSSTSIAGFSGIAAGSNTPAVSTPIADPPTHTALPAPEASRPGDPAPSALYPNGDHRSTALIKVRNGRPWITEKHLKVVNATLVERYTDRVVRQLLGADPVRHPLMLLSFLDIKEAKARAHGAEVLVTGVTSPRNTLSWATWVWFPWSQQMHIYCREQDVKVVSTCLLRSKRMSDLFSIYCRDEVKVKSLELIAFPATVAESDSGPAAFLALRRIVRHYTHHCAAFVNRETDGMWRVKFSSDGHVLDLEPTANSRGFLRGRVPPTSDETPAELEHNPPKPSPLICAPTSLPHDFEPPLGEYSPERLAQERRADMSNFLRGSGLVRELLEESLAMIIPPELQAPPTGECLGGPEAENSVVLEGESSQQSGGQGEEDDEMEDA